MKFWKHDESEEKLKKLLKLQQSDFDFNQQGVKNRLQLSIARASSAQPTFRTSAWMPRWGLAIAAITLFVLSGSTFALANNAKPGDRLYLLDKAQEQIWTRLPLPASNKAQIQAGIVEERAYELDQLRKSDKANKIKAVKESEQSLQQAVEAVSNTRTKLESSGKRKQVEKLDSVLTRLELLAEEQEQKIEEIKTEIDDDEVKADIDKSLLKIRKSKERAKSEISEIKERIDSEDSKKENSDRKNRNERDQDND